MTWMLWSPGSVICREQYKKLSMTKMLSWIKDVMWLKLPCGECSYISPISQIIPSNKNNAEKLYILMLTVMKSALILNKCIKLPRSSFLSVSMMFSMIHNLDHNVEVQGIVKPGANIEAIVNTSTKNIEKLTKKDIVVVWGGTRDIGKNESVKGLHQ